MNKKKIIVFILFFISVGIRAWLGYVNRQANDDHMQVINWIADKHEIPNRGDCWECFQPKFFYVVTAGLLTVFKVQIPEYRIVAIQFFDILLGFFTLLFFWRLLKKQPLNETAKVLLFAFFALNPRLIAINAQATNDTMEILGGVMTVYYCDSFFRNLSLKTFVFMVLSLLLAGLTKATGIIFFIVICLFFIFKIFSSDHRAKRMLLSKYLTGVILAFTLIIFIGGGYYSYYKTYTSLPSSTWKKDSPAYFFKETQVSRPGVSSLAGAFFTFRYLDMIKQPYITNGSANYPLHRTSLWSQLYGRAVFLQFDRWPPSWQTKSPFVISTGRILIIIGIVPLILFLIGLGKEIAAFFRNILKHGKEYLSENTGYLHAGMAIVLLATSVSYCYMYRDFSAMKDIYIFPGLISFMLLFINGYKMLKARALVMVTNAVLIAMMALTLADTFYLIHQLSIKS